jgi:hypothetical protein
VWLVWWASREGPPAPTAAEPVPVTPSALPRLVYRTGAVGHTVRVPFEAPLAPTADPRVWLYHPGTPHKAHPETIRVEFADPPALPLPAPLCVVVGRVDRIDIDLRRRLNQVPGCVVLTSASVVAPATPPPGR